MDYSQNPTIQPFNNAPTNNITSHKKHNLALTTTRSLIIHKHLFKIKIPIHNPLHP